MELTAERLMTYFQIVLREWKEEFLDAANTHDSIVTDDRIFDWRDRREFGAEDDFVDLGFCLSQNLVVDLFEFFRGGGHVPSPDG